MSQDNVGPESPSGSNSKDAIFEPKPKPKMIRVLTVLAYVLSVSMAAILLSIYYIFMWDGRPHVGARRGSGVETMEPHNFSERNMTPTFSNYISYQGDVSNISKAELPRIPNNVTEEDASDGGVERVNETDVYQKELNITKRDITTSFENQNEQELQQQITAIESEEVAVSSTIPTTSEESVTWPDDYDEFDRPAGIFLKKIIGRYDY